MPYPTAPGRQAVPPVPGLRVGRSTDDDAAELLVLQRCCWVSEALANDTLDIPPLHETLEDVRAWQRSWHTLVGRLGCRLVCAVRGRAVGDDWTVGRLMVAPDLAGRGLGSWLLTEIEALAPAGSRAVTLFTGARSERNLRVYARAGYERDETAMSAPSHVPGTVALRKVRLTRVAGPLGAGVSAGPAGRSGPAPA